MIDVNKMESAISSDLGLGLTALKGHSISINKCWHFYTSGESVDVLFRNDEDFRNGMNRIYPVADCYDILILSFVLMDTHIHFILYGDFEPCNRFIHEYVRRTSLYLSSKYQERKALSNIQISHQVIDDDRYLKTAICYVIKNPINAGLTYNVLDYPWSSGALYFREPGLWTSPMWMHYLGEGNLSRNKMKKQFRTHSQLDVTIPMVEGMIFPGAYTAVELVEKIFRTHKAFNFFMCISKDMDIEAREGVVSHLTIPISELREHRMQLSMELFGQTKFRELNVAQRLKLARVLKNKYNSSTKQIARACGLIYEEVKELL